jgi:peptidoglycan/LPS O-acetylase OafA/YrhL
VAKWLSTSTLVFLGNASYSMYILHAPITNWLNIFFRRALDREPVGWVWVWTYLFVTILVSSAFYKFAEDPMHRRLRSALNRRLKTVTR